MNMNIKNSAYLIVFVATALAMGASLAFAQMDGPAIPGERPDEAVEGNMDQPEPPSADPEASPEIVKTTASVMGFEIIPKTGTYAITADANVRKGPGTENKVIGSLKQGKRVQIVGQAEGKDWYAVSKDGEILGFVYSKIMLPVVDGTLSEETRGVLMQKGAVCDYRFRFEGKTEVEGGAFDTSDYEIRFRCAGEKGEIVFYSHMFLTEAAIKKSFHQISMDVRSIGDGMEKYLTTNFLYDPKTGELKFDGHSIPKFAAPPEMEKINVKTFQEALLLVMKTSVSSWTDDAWDSLFAKSAN